MEAVVTPNLVHQRKDSTDSYLRQVYNHKLIHYLEVARLAMRARFRYNFAGSGDWRG